VKISCTTFALVAAVGFGLATCLVRRRVHDGAYHGLNAIWHGEPTFAFTRTCSYRKRVVKLAGTVSNAVLSSWDTLASTSVRWTHYIILPSYYRLLGFWFDELFVLSTKTSDDCSDSMRNPNFAKQRGSSMFGYRSATVCREQRA
jgi:hypothetical protein